MNYFEGKDTFIFKIAKKEPFKLKLISLKSVVKIIFVLFVYSEVLVMISSYSSKIKENLLFRFRKRDVEITVISPDAEKFIFVANVVSNSISDMKGVNF